MGISVCECVCESFNGCLSFNGYKCVCECNFMCLCVCVSFNGCENGCRIKGTNAKRASNSERVRVRHQLAEQASSEERMSVSCGCFSFTSTKQKQKQKQKQKL
jgi:hypothetical protein